MSTKKTKEQSEAHEDILKILKDYIPEFSIMEFSEEELDNLSNLVETLSEIGLEEVLSHLEKINGDIVPMEDLNPDLVKIDEVFEKLFTNRKEIIARIKVLKQKGIYSTGIEAISIYLEIEKLNKLVKDIRTERVCYNNLAIFYKHVLDFFQTFYSLNQKIIQVCLTYPLVL